MIVNAMFQGRLLSPGGEEKPVHAGIVDELEFGGDAGYLRYHAVRNFSCRKVSPKIGCRWLQAVL